MEIPEENDSSTAETQAAQEPAVKVPVEAKPKKRALNKTKIITYSAALSALGMIVVMFMPTVDIGITSVTPASHVPLMLAMMIHPIVAAFTGVVTAVSFLLKHANPMVIFRATSHLLYAVPGAFLAQLLFKSKDKETNYKTLTVKALILNGATAVLHAAFEMLAVTLGFYVLTAIGTPLPAGFDFSAYGVFVALGLITLAHSIVDFLIAYAVYVPLRRAKLVSIRE